LEFAGWATVKTTAAATATAATTFWCDLMAHHHQAYFKKPYLGIFSRTDSIFWHQEPIFSK
jgi:hypothetical protein